MLLCVTRTVILYLLTVLSLRFMGKRQIGELRPSDLVTTILVSNLASVPVEETNLPFLPSVAPIVVIVCIEVILSCIESRSARFSRLLSGKSVPVVLNGEVRQDALRELRFSADDLMEALRQKDIFDIGEVALAIVETGGKLTVLRRDAVGDGGVPAAVVCDGALEPLGLRLSGLREEEVAQRLAKTGVPQEEVFLLQLRGDETTVIRKDRRA